MSGEMPDENLYVSFTDLRALFRRHRDRLFRTGSWVAAIIFLFLILSEPKYRVNATFKQAPAHQGEQQAAFKSLLKNVGWQQDESSPIGIMRSRTILKEVVSILGLQVHEEVFPLSMRTLDTIWDNLCAELWLKIEDRDLFSFKDVSYDGEEETLFFLRLLDDGAFEWLNRDKRLLTMGQIGERVSYEGITFTLERIPIAAERYTLHPFRFTPWIEEVDAILKDLQVMESKFDSNIFNLSFRHRDRHLASKLLNQMMASMQSYIRRENGEIASAQKVYLDARRKELLDELDQALEENVRYLSEGGCLSLEQEIELLSEPKRALLSRLRNLDLEMGKLQLTEPIGMGRHQFSNLSLETAQKLKSKDQERLDFLITEIGHLELVLRQLPDPDFDLASLSSVVTAQEQLRSATALCLQLKDEWNWSQKDQQRLKEALETHKKFFSEHIAQKIQLDQKELSFLQEKLSSLSGTTAELIESERRAIRDQLVDLNLQMGAFPEKWRLENQLTFKRELAIGMIQAITQLAESKNIHKNLYQVESRPLDIAIAPLKAQLPFLFLTTLFTFIGTIGLLFAIKVAKCIVRGFPVTEEMLQMRKWTVCGHLSHGVERTLDRISNQDLETLRNIGDFLLVDRKGLSAVLIQGHTPDYSHHLARLFSLRGKTVALISCTFKRSDSGTGLLQYIEGQSQIIPMQRRDGYVYISSGGQIRYGAELLHHTKFKDLISRLSKEYDLVLISSDAETHENQAMALASSADAVLLTLNGVTYAELAPFRSWASTSRRLAFLLSDG